MLAALFGEPLPAVAGRPLTETPLGSVCLSKVATVLRTSATIHCEVAAVLPTPRPISFEGQINSHREKNDVNYVHSDGGSK